MSYDKNAKMFFYLSPLLLILWVFTITWLCHFYLQPMFLVVPLLAAYYSYIWIAIFAYRRISGSAGPVLAGGLFRFHLKGFTPWIWFWIFAYPLAAGGLAFSATAPLISIPWILGGIPFCLIRGPPGEIFWRLFLDRCGADAGLTEKIRLWYSSAVFASWHFIFIVFLYPPGQIPFTLPITIAVTFISGLLWMLTYRKTGTIIHNITSHAVLNFLMIWPWGVASVLGVNPLPL